MLPITLLLWSRRPQHRPLRNENAAGDKYSHTHSHSAQVQPQVQMRAQSDLNGRHVAIITILCVYTEATFYVDIMYIPIHVK